MPCKPVTRQTNPTSAKPNNTEPKTKMSTEDKQKKGGDDMGTLATALGKIMIQMQEEGRKDREREREESNKNLLLLTSKLESLQHAQTSNLEAQRLSIKTPLPKYAGKQGEFHDWKLAVLNCIKLNDWREERRILEMLPSCFSGQAARVYSSFTSSQKNSLDTVFQALKESLEPEGKALNREMFIKAKRKPGESMRAFISRCSQYIVRSDEVDDIADSPWAAPFLIEKVYANLKHSDMKILRCTIGKTEDIQLLCTKADELISLSEEVVGALGQEGQARGCQSQPPSGYGTSPATSWTPYAREGRKVNKWQNCQTTHGQTWQSPTWQPRWNNISQANTQRFRPGGEATNDRVLPQEQAAQGAQALHPQNPNPLN